MNEKEFDYLNVIPLVDVMLVMLTIVLTTSSFIATGSIPVELPRAAKTKTEALKNEVIDLTRTGRISLNAKAVTLDELRRALQPGDRERPVLIRADRSIKLQGFVDVLDAVKGLGYKTVSLQTENRP